MRMIGCGQNAVRIDLQPLEDLPMSKDLGPKGKLLKFPESEIAPRKALNDLFDEWQATMAAILPLDKADLIDYFVRDGFYPFYFSQPLKILFVGKECLDLAGCDYLEVLLKSYRTDKTVGDQHLNTHKFHSRLLYVAYGLLNGGPEWDDIPFADVIGDTFATPEGISCAFMNVSKFSNEREESGHWAANHSLMDFSVLASGIQRRFVEEQIAILKPDVVISMNLGPFLDNLGTRESEIRSHDLNLSRLTSQGHSSVLVDAWHFSYTRVDSVKNIYHPIRESLRRAADQGWLDGGISYDFQAKARMDV